jgi:hypothetical protein
MKGVPPNLGMKLTPGPPEPTSSPLPFLARLKAKAYTKA